MCQNVVLVVWDSSTVTMAEMQVSFVKVYNLAGFVIWQVGGLVKIGQIEFHEH